MMTVVVSAAPGQRRSTNVARATGRETMAVGVEATMIAQEVKAGQGAPAVVVAGLQEKEPIAVGGRTCETESDLTDVRVFSARLLCSV